MSEPSLIQHFKGHRNVINSLAINPVTENNQIVTGSSDCSIIIWNFKQRIRCMKFSGHNDQINCVTWSKKGDLIATASADRSIRIWIPTVQGGSTEFRAHTSNIRSVDFDSTGRKVIHKF